ncbi:MAG: tetratricopeptide repeat protein [Candidatus Yanofskybacteria bacterium]|nr:tetratricopeptide repeat protein [Candidatus Yanofskybacteria bacterium]
MSIKFWGPPAAGHDVAQADMSVAASAAAVAGDVVQEDAAVLARSSDSAARSHLYTRIVRWILGVGVFLIPLFFLPSGTGILEFNKQILLMIVAGSGLIVWLLGIVVSGRMSLRSAPLNKGVGALLLASVVATIFSISQYKSLFGFSISLSDSLVSVLGLGIFYFLAINVYDDQGKMLGRLLTGSLVVALLFGVLQMMTMYVLGGAFAHSRAFNSVGSLNTLGLLAALGLPLFMKVAIPIAKKSYLDVAKLGVPLAVLILAILNWWALWAVAIIGMLVTIGLDSLAMASSGPKAFKVSRLLLPMTVVVLGVFLLIIKFNFKAVKDQLPVEVAPSYGLSTDVAKSVLKEKLVTGYGPENFTLAFDKYGASRLTNSTLSNLKFYDGTSQIHNFVVQGGLIAILAFLVFLWAVVETITKALRSREAKSHPMYSAVLAVLTSVMVALFLYPFNLTLMFFLYITAALGGLIILGQAKHTWDIEEKPFVSLASSLGFIAGLIMVLAGSYFTVAQYLADTTYAQATAEPVNDKAVALYMRAVNWSGKNDRYYRAASQGALNLLSAEVNSNDRNDPQRPARIQNYIASTIDLAKSATNADPHESNNWFNLANTYQSLIGLVDGVDRLAEDAYLKALETRPGDASIANRIGSMYLAKADLDRQLARSAGSNADRFLQDADASLVKAETYFNQAIGLAGNYGLAIYNLGAVYDRQGKVNDSIRQLERIIPYNANQPNLLFELGLLYYRVGRKDDAKAALERAVVLSSSFANARWYLGLIYEERGDFDSAIAQMEKILENNKDNTIVLQKIEDLKAGKTQFPPEKVTDQKPL